MQIVNFLLWGSLFWVTIMLLANYVNFEKIRFKAGIGSYCVREYKICTSEFDWNLCATSMYDCGNYESKNYGNFNFTQPQKIENSSRIESVAVFSAAQSKANENLCLFSVNVDKSICENLCFSSDFSYDLDENFEFAPKDEIQSLRPAGENHTAWMVSNCESTRGAVVRKEFTDRLVKHGLKLDGYGECYDNVMVRTPWDKPHYDTDTFGEFTKYKFYLAFENSMHCNDYVSEKFWRNSLTQFMVPIVYGPHPDDVKRMAPPHSYIHVEDYDSPHELTKYLDYLDQNMTAYMEYHEWRKAPADVSLDNASKNTERMYCGVCKEVVKRKNLGFPKKIIPSVASWWWMNVHDDECTSGQELPQWLIDTPVVTSENMYDELKELSFNGNGSPKR